MHFSNKLSLKNSMLNFQIILGIEIHIKLNTKSKLFSSASNIYSNSPNVNIDAYSLGLPGVLPVVNKKAIEKAILLSCALNCSIPELSIFERKNYFYPDLPKNYQISQNDFPIAKNGYININSNNNIKYKISIKRVHIEEDAGKLIHKNNDNDFLSNNLSLVDYNRSGSPLIEIVTNPIKSIDDNIHNVVVKYIKYIKALVVGLNISDGKMNLGSMRCDINISLKHLKENNLHNNSLGVRVEIKNLNSTKNIKESILYEIKRQSLLITSNQKVVQETRHWNEFTKSTVSGRLKEKSANYRYFPDPDIPPIFISKFLIKKIREKLNLYLDKKKELYVLQKKWEFSKEDMQNILLNKSFDFVKKSIEYGIPSKFIKKWFLKKILGSFKKYKIYIKNLDKVSIKNIFYLYKKIKAKKVNNQIAEMIFVKIFKGENNIKNIIKNNCLKLNVNKDLLSNIILKFLEENNDLVKKIFKGKKNVIEVIIGEVMKKTKGRADAAYVRSLVLKIIKNLSFSNDKKK